MVNSGATHTRGFVVHCDRDGAWAWEFVPGSQHEYWVGECIATGNRWSGMIRISGDLVQTFDHWRTQWCLVDF